MRVLYWSIRLVCVVLAILVGAYLCGIAGWVVGARLGGGGAFGEPAAEGAASGLLVGAILFAIPAWFVGRWLTAAIRSLEFSQDTELNHVE